jgi:hypothetical protein
VRNYYGENADDKAFVEGEKDTSIYHKGRLGDMAGCGSWFSSAYLGWNERPM